MHQIGIGILLYENDNGRECPPDLATVWKQEKMSGDLFVCPSSGDTPATTPALLTSGGHLSYTYIRPNAAFRTDEFQVILYENMGNHGENGINLLFGNGNVRWEPIPEAKRLIDESLKNEAK